MPGAWFPGSTLYPMGLACDSHQHLNALVIKATECMSSVIALLVHNGINYVIGYAQGNEHPGKSSPMCSRKHGLALKRPKGSKIPCATGPLTHSLAMPGLNSPPRCGPCSGTSSHLGHSMGHIHLRWERLCVISRLFMVFINIFRVFIFIQRLVASIPRSTAILAFLTFLFWFLLPFPDL